MRALLVAAALLAWAPAPAQSRADRAAAGRLFHAGQDLYGRGQYLDAAQSFHAAFEKVPDPSFLFNEARAYERANELEKAITSYQAYLSAAPDAPDVVEVEQKVATLRARLRARETGAAPAIETDERAAAASEPAPADRFHVHTMALTLAPIFWLTDSAENKFRLAGEYRYGLTAVDALAGQIAYVPDLVSGRSNSASGFGLGAFYLRTIPLSAPLELLLRAGAAFERYTALFGNSQLLALRFGPGLAWRFSDAVAVSLEALVSTGLFFFGDNTLEGRGGGADLALTLEPAATLVLGL